MNPILRNVLAVIAGVIAGSVINMGIIMIMVNVIPMPPGVDPMDPESLKANMHLFEFRHFIGPFLAHAIGTLAGAYTAARLAAGHKMKFALGIGVFFLAGGIYNVATLGGPLWFAALDLIVAYLPMAWLGGKWASKS